MTLSHSASGAPIAPSTSASNIATQPPILRTDLDENEKEVILEFTRLLEKSKQLFNGLRDLPQHGQRQWQSYFGRTFDIYTKLWKFQQQNRQVLDQKYDLKRWQIGEIASKIGQLYYHYYLRTSETNYLNEAFSFYSAIKNRQYYSKASKEERSDLMVKKLRYYARFIVVCLLLKKMKLCRDLIKDLHKHIEDYSSIYEPEDRLEWQLVVSEVKAFLEAEYIVRVVDVDSSSVVLSHRLNAFNTPPLERTLANPLTLQEILIVGNTTNQVKYSELTLDMFRMLQILEREPSEEPHLYDTSPALARNPNIDPHGTSERLAKRENPHKYLLYKPTFGQIYNFLAHGLKELPQGGAMLIYLSADGSKVYTTQPQDYGYDLGGVLLNNKAPSIDPNAPPPPVQATSGKRGQTSTGGSGVSAIQRQTHVLHPGDFNPFTRRPLFLIVDSDNSTVFKHIPNLFNQALAVLMSPEVLPERFQADSPNKGNLFTLFLHSPLLGFCYICNKTEISVALWDKGLTQLDRFVTDCGRIITKIRSMDYVWLQFFADDFLRLLIIRFVFCFISLSLHKSFKGGKDPEMLPSCHPPMPRGSDLLENSGLQKLVLELASFMEAGSCFLGAHGDSGF